MTGKLAETKEMTDEDLKDMWDHINEDKGFHFYDIQYHGGIWSCVARGQDIKRGYCWTLEVDFYGVDENCNPNNDSSTLTAAIYFYPNTQKYRVRYRATVTNERRLDFAICNPDVVRGILNAITAKNNNKPKMRDYWEVTHDQLDNWHTRLQRWSGLRNPSNVWVATWVAIWLSFFTVGTALMITHLWLQIK